MLHLLHQIQIAFPVMCTVLSVLEPITSYATTPPCVVNLTLNQHQMLCCLPVLILLSLIVHLHLFLNAVCFSRFVTLEYAYVPTPVFINASPDLPPQLHLQSHHQQYLHHFLQLLLNLLPREHLYLLLILLVLGYCTGLG